MTTTPAPCDATPLLFTSRSPQYDPAAAKAICSGCYRQTECLRLALAEPNPDPDVWGGTTGREREQMREKATI